MFGDKEEKKLVILMGVVSIILFAVIVWKYLL